MLVDYTKKEVIRLMNSVAGENPSLTRRGGGALNVKRDPLFKGRGVSHRSGRVPAARDEAAEERPI